jgi:hypothetical protein
LISFKGDVTDPDDASSACDSVDALIHLAAIMPPKSEASEELTSKVNVEGLPGDPKLLRELICLDFTENVVIGLLLS